MNLIFVNVIILTNKLIDNINNDATVPREFKDLLFVPKKYLNICFF